MEEMVDQSFLPPPYQGRKDELQKLTNIEKTLLKHNKNALPSSSISQLRVDSMA